MKPIHVCVPVLRRYDLLRELILSLNESAVRPAMMYVIDNGQAPRRMKMAAAWALFPVDVMTPEEPLGVAASWNTFIAHAPEERIIVNDDVTFAPDSLGRLVAAKGDLVLAAGLGFSCFVLRDRCVEKVGLFDVEISPGYGYYEDEDYLQRIDGRGTRERVIEMTDVDCGASHRKSSTLAANSPAEMAEHHRKFMIAQGNYVRKWRLEETFR